MRMTGHIRRCSRVNAFDVRIYIEYIYKMESVPRSLCSFYFRSSARKRAILKRSSRSTLTKDEIGREREKRRRGITHRRIYSEELVDRENALRPRRILHTRARPYISPLSFSRTSMAAVYATTDRCLSDTKRSAIRDHNETRSTL